MLHIYIYKSIHKVDNFQFATPFSYCNLLAVCANQATEEAKCHNFLSQLWTLVLHPNDHTVKCALK